MTRSYAVQNPTRRTKRASGESGASSSAMVAGPVQNLAPTAPSMMNPPPRPRPPPTVSMEIDMEGEESSGSEYETDPDAEPEEFYLSLDLTIPTPIHAGPSSNPHANVAAASTIPPPLPLSSTTRSGRSGRRHLPSRPSHSHQSHPTPSTPQHPPPDEDAPPNQIARWAGGDGGRLQLLDLHSENPLISFNNRIWSGSWMNTVGTELYILCPEGPAPEDSVEVRGVYISQKDTSAAAAATTGAAVGVAGALPEPPLGVVGTDPDVGKVIAMSSARIHCLPAVVTAKERRFGVEEEGRTYGWRPGKSTFLERLEAIQIAKGERKARGEEEEEEHGEGEEEEEEEDSSEVESVEVEGTAFQMRMDGAGSEEDEGGEEDGEDQEMDEAERAEEQEKQRFEKEGYFALGWEGEGVQEKEKETAGGGALPPIKE